MQELDHPNREEKHQILWLCTPEYWQGASTLDHCSFTNWMQSLESGCGFCRNWMLASCTSLSGDLPASYGVPYFCFCANAVWCVSRTILLQSCHGVWRETEVFCDAQWRCKAGRGNVDTFALHVYLFVSLIRSWEAIAIGYIQLTACECGLLQVLYHSGVCKDVASEDAGLLGDSRTLLQFHNAEFIRRETQGLNEIELTFGRD